MLKKGLTPGSKREYSTSTFWAPSDGLDKHVPELEADLAPASEAVAQAAPASLLPVGAKFPLPDLPLPSNCHIHHRYSPIVEQVTNLIMKDGKVWPPDRAERGRN